MGKNAISPIWKKHQNLLSNNNDAQSITKNGFLVRPHTHKVGLRVHCASSPPPPPTIDESECNSKKEADLYKTEGKTRLSELSILKSWHITDSW